MKQIRTPADMVAHILHLEDRLAQQQPKRPPANDGAACAVVAFIVVAGWLAGVAWLLSLL